MFLLTSNWGSSDFTLLGMTHVHLSCIKKFEIISVSEIINEMLVYQHLFLSHLSISRSFGIHTSIMYCCLECLPNELFLILLHCQRHVRSWYEYVVRDSDCLVLQEWLMVVFTGDVVGFKVIFIAQSPIEHPTDVVLPLCVVSFYQPLL